MPRDVSELRDAAAIAVERGKLDKALALYDELEELEPESPMWPKRLGETHRRAGNNRSAVAAFERSVDKYVETGFLVQAIAVCKLILQIDPMHQATQDRLIELNQPAKPKAAASTQPIAPAAAKPPTREMVIDNPMIKRGRDFGIENPVVVRPSQALPGRRHKQITLPPPRAAFDAVPLEDLVPNSERRKHQDGTDTGVTMIQLDFDDLELVEPMDVDLDSVEIDMSTDRPKPPISVTAADKPAKPPSMPPRARTALTTTPLFSQIAPPVLERLVQRMSLVELVPDQILFCEGEPGAALYVISEGEVAVESGTTELARLGPSEFFGEIAIVTDLPRSATIRAVVRTELLAIDREVVRDAAAEYPELITVLLRFVRERLVDRVARTSELFRPFNDDERAQLAAGFELLEIAPEISLVTEGERADGLYVVMAGTLEVRRANAPKPIARLGSGDVFGELSLLANAGAMASVVSRSRVVALRLPQARFNELIMTHPQVLEYLGELSAKRSPPTASDSVVDFHIDML